MYDSTYSIQEIKTHKYLPCYFLDQVKRKPLVVVALQNFKQVYSQNLKDHAKVIAIGSFVKEGVQQV